MTKQFEFFGDNIHWVMDLPGEMFAVKLDGKNTIARELKKLQINSRFGVILRDPDTYDFYSLRSSDGRVHVIFRVLDNAVQFCRGMGKSRPTNYMSQVVSFIIGSGFDIAADMAGTGLIRQNGKYYNVYDLPKNFIVYGDMDLSYAGLIHLPDMKGMTIRGNYDISGNRLIGLSGVPSVVNGDFIAKNNMYSAVTQNPPKYTVIRGKFINDFCEQSR